MLRVRPAGRMNLNRRTDRHVSPICDPGETTTLARVRLGRQTAALKPPMQ
jgi:hypothetical protein